MAIGLFAVNVAQCFFSKRYEVAHARLFLLRLWRSRDYAEDR